MTPSSYFQYLDMDALYPARRPVEKTYIWLRSFRDFRLEAKPFASYVDALEGLERIQSSSITKYSLFDPFAPRALSIGRPTRRSLKLLQERVASKKRLWKPTLVGSAAESFTRQVFVKAKQYGALFGSIPQRNNLGKIAIENGKKADFRTTLDLSNGRRIRLLGEFKNHLCEFQAADEAGPNHRFRRLLEDALECDYQPLFVCSYASREARALWKKIGLAYHVYDRQFVPLSWKRQIESQELIPRDLMHYFEFIDPERPIRETRMSDKVRADIEVFSNPVWIEKANAVWERHRAMSITPKIIDLLKAKKVQAIHELVDS